MLQANGQISLSQIATEFGDSPPFSMSEYFGVDTGVPSSGNPINFASFFSKGSAFTISITTNQLQLNLLTFLLANGWNGTQLAKVTIETGVYIWSDNTSVAALNMGGTYPMGLTLINKGFIIGKGGTGGSCALVASVPSYVSTPTAGGMAINITGPITIDNTEGYIGGGGGGGAASLTTTLGIFVATTTSPGGGGAGGGLGGVYTSDNILQGPATASSTTPPGPGGLGSSQLGHRNPVDATYGVPTLGTSGGAGGSAGISYLVSIGGGI